MYACSHRRPDPLGITVGPNQVRGLVVPFHLQLGHDLGPQPDQSLRIGGGPILARSLLGVYDTHAACDTHTYRKAGEEGGGAVSLHQARAMTAEHRTICKSLGSAEEDWKITYHLEEEGATFYHQV